MYLALFLISLLYLYLIKEEKQPFYRYAVLAAVFVLFPLTGVLFDWYFQGMYAKEALQWLLPVYGVTSYAVMDMYTKQWEKWKKAALLPAACIIFLLCGYLSGSASAAKLMENNQETEEVYNLLLEQKEEDMLVLLAAPRELMEYARQYDADILTVYGRDIWEPELNYAFYDLYDPWVYELAEDMNKPLDEYRQEILSGLAKSGATHVVFDKDNLTFGADMQYPSRLVFEEMTLYRAEETRHYVIYVRTR